MQKLADHPFIVILGVLSSCIAVFVFVTGINQISEIFNPPGDIPDPTQEIAPAPATEVVEESGPLPGGAAEPTQPIPAPTENRDTPPGTILEIGRPWRENGFELTLTNAGAAYTCPSNTSTRAMGVDLKLQLTNKNPQDISIRYSLGDAVSALSNQGQSLPVGYLDMLNTYANCGGHPWANVFEEIATIIGAAETIELYSITNLAWDSGKLFINTDPSDPALTEIIISVTGIADIRNARWRIPISH